MRYGCACNLLHKMKKMSFQTHIIMLIKNLYEQQKAQVRTAHGLSESFIIAQGVRQSCMLSPHRFNIYAVANMRALDNFEGTITIGRRNMSDLRYADYVVWIAVSMQELQESVNRVVSKAGIFLNADKTECYEN